MPITADILRKYIHPSKIFVETGTHKGDGVQAAIDAGYTSIWSCELDKNLWGACMARFDGHLLSPTIKHTDSVSFLKDLADAENLSRVPCTLWLDAHPDHDAPVLQELGVLAQWARNDHTILIDDRRLMQGHWKSVRESDVILALLEINPEYAITFEDSWAGKDDIIVARVAW